MKDISVYLTRYITYGGKEIPVLDISQISDDDWEKLAYRLNQGQLSGGENHG